MSRRRLLQRNAYHEEAATRRHRFQSPFRRRRQNATLAPVVPAIISATKVPIVLDPQDEVPYTTLSNSTLLVGTEYLTAVSSLKSHRQNKKNESPSGFFKKFAEDGMTQAGENVAEGMEQSALIVSLNIAVAMERAMDKSSKNFCKTAKDYLDFIKAAFGAWFIIYVCGSENKLAVFVAVSLLVYSTCKPLQMKLSSYSWKSQCCKTIHTNGLPDSYTRR